MTPSTIPDAEVPAALAAAYTELRRECDYYATHFRSDNAPDHRFCPECHGTGYLPLTGPEAVVAMLALAQTRNWYQVQIWPPDAHPRAYDDDTRQMVDLPPETDWEVDIEVKEGARMAHGEGLTLELALGRALLAAKGGA